MDNEQLKHYGIVVFQAVLLAVGIVALAFVCDWVVNLIFKIAEVT
jgi:hypothetical protein